MLTRNLRTGIFPLLALFGAAAVVPSRGMLEGRLLSQTGDTPIAGAQASLAVAGLTRITDEDGRFSFGDSDVQGPDTLVLSHRDFDSVRVPLGTSEWDQWNLEIMLRPIFRAPSIAQADTRRRATVFAEGSGGLMWRSEEFQSYLSFSRAVDLLLYSGLVEEIRGNSRESLCVLIRVSRGCAEIRVDHDTPRPDYIGAWLPSEVDSFVVVPPPSDATGSALVGENGLVVVFVVSV